jgi:anti-anti-sigma factor
VQSRVEQQALTSDHLEACGMTDLTNPIQRPAGLPGSARSPDRLPLHPLVCAETVHHGEGVDVYVRGDLDLASSPALIRRLLELLNLPIRSLTLNLAELDFIDSSGLAALNTIHANAEERRITFTLASIPPQALRVLELTGLSQHFNVVHHQPTTN